jgi:hypothetical protein
VFSRGGIGVVLLVGNKRALCPQAVNPAVPFLLEPKWTTGMEKITLQAKEALYMANKQPGGHD